MNTRLSTDSDSYGPNHGPSDTLDLSFYFFGLILSACLYISITKQGITNLYVPNELEMNERCVFEQIRDLRTKNPKKVTMGHLNINSIPNKFEGIMDLVSNQLDIFLISETKIDSSFPDAQFSHGGYSKPHRKDRILGGGGGLLLYVNDNIPSRQLTEHVIPDDIEIMCVEINLKKQKWVLLGIYRPPKMNEKYFLDHLSRVIDVYSRKYDKIVIMGDFNLEPTDEPIESLCNTYNLYNLVKEKTCFKGPPKCYDLILTNCKYNFQSTMAVTSGFSDFHKMTLTVLKTEFVKADPIQIKYRDYKNYCSSNFNKELKEKLNRDCTSLTDYNKFQSILCEVLDKHAPQKKKYLRANNSSFMTKELRKMIMNRSRCKNIFFKNKTVENWEKYRRLRNDCVKLTNKVKKEYFRNLDIRSVNDNKKFWKIVKPNFSEKNSKSSKIILVENDEIITDNKRSTEIMNDYFVNITKELNIPAIYVEKQSENTDTGFLDPIDQIIHSYRRHPSILKINEFVTHTGKFSFTKVNEHQIENEILDLNPKKATGPDTIPPKIIKDASRVLKSPLADLFNTTVEISQFPTALKYANVSPIYKKDDNTRKENYRPISILPSISKFFERLIFQQVTSYVSRLLSPYLCGFRKGYNAQHALLRLKNNMNICLDKREKVGLFMMDLSKAFDCIPHELLIAKLYAYGFSDKSLKLIYSYLKKRSQRVNINAEYSSWKHILNGVPQGSVLGPLLFNIFINDLFLFVENSEVCNYADDNSLTVANISIEKIVTALESDIGILEKWFKDNGMQLNEEKCQFMIIEPSQTFRNDIAKIKTENKIIEEVKKGKLLGITFDSNLSMDRHIKQLCKQASNKLYALARISHYLDEQKRIILMKSFVISQFNYCPIIWMYCQRKTNNRINRIHERALRIAYHDYVSDFQSLLEKADTVTIHQKNIQVLTLEIYKTLNNLNPEFMREIFCLKRHNYPTRNQNLTYPNPHSVIYGLESFGYKATQLWNAIPREIQESNNMTTFKRYISTQYKICKCNLCKLYLSNLGYIT